MRYVAEVTVRTEQFQADDEEDARASARLLVPAYLQVLEIEVYELEDTDG